MPEPEAIFDEGRMAPRPESGLYGLPANEGGTSPATPLLGSGPEEGRPAAPGQSSAEGQEKQPAADDAEFDGLLHAQPSISDRHCSIHAISFPTIGSVTSSGSFVSATGRQLAL